METNLYWSLHEILDKNKQTSKICEQKLLQKIRNRKKANKYDSKTIKYKTNNSPHRRYFFKLNSTTAVDKIFTSLLIMNKTSASFNLKRTRKQPLS